MNPTKLAILFTALSASAAGQTGYTATFSATGQPVVHLESKLEPETPALANAFETGTASRNKVFQRYLYNKSAHEYFGYSLLLEPVSAAEYRVTLGPIKLNPAEHPISDPLAQLMPSPVFPPPQVVSIGDKVAIDFFENTKTGQKIVDYISLERSDCDNGSPTPDCLTTMVSDMERKLQTIDTRLDPIAQNKLRQSQQSWETYRDDTCGGLPDRSKQLECKSKLTRSRIHDLEMIYP